MLGGAVWKHPHWIGLCMASRPRSASCHRGISRRCCSAAAAQRCSHPLLQIALLASHRLLDGLEEGLELWQSDLGKGAAGGHRRLNLGGDCKGQGDGREEHGTGRPISRKPNCPAPQVSFAKPYRLSSARPALTCCQVDVCSLGARLGWGLGRSSLLRRRSTGRLSRSGGRRHAGRLGGSIATSSKRGRGGGRHRCGSGSTGWCRRRSRSRCCCCCLSSLGTSWGLGCCCPLLARCRLARSCGWLLGGCGRSGSCNLLESWSTGLAATCCRRCLPQRQRLPAHSCCAACCGSWRCAAWPRPRRPLCLCMQLLSCIKGCLQAGGHGCVLPPLPLLHACGPLPSPEGSQAELSTQLGSQVYGLAAAAAAVLPAGFRRLVGQLLLQLASGGEGERRRWRRLWSGSPLRGWHPVWPPVASSGRHAQLVAQKLEESGLQIDCRGAPKLRRAVGWCQQGDRARRCFATFVCLQPATVSQLCARPLRHPPRSRASTACTAGEERRSASGCRPKVPSTRQGG